MAADPELKLVPAGTEVLTHDLITTPEAEKSELDTVDDLLEQGDVQAAPAHRPSANPGTGPGQALTRYQGAFAPNSEYPRTCSSVPMAAM